MVIYVAGITGLVGSHIAKIASSRGFHVEGKASRDLDFTDRQAVIAEILEVKPDYLVIAAARVGGIGANSKFPVEFLSTNLQIQTNLIDAAHYAKVKKVLFLGSSCIYPKLSRQPIQEGSLMTGKLEESNEAYALAKIAGIGLIDAYRKQYQYSWISAMPTNLYGPGDNFDLDSSHVLPALIRKFHEGKVSRSDSVEIWGDGTPLREFLFVEDFAEACFTLLDQYDNPAPINIGSGQEISIAKLSKLIADIVGFEGHINFNELMPNGTPRKFLDSSRIFNLGWRPNTTLETGITKTFDWYLENLTNGENQ
jgi:GDP-L-fucose synthase